MPRSLSRSPSHRRRYSPSPVGHRHGWRSRRDQSRSRSRRGSRSSSPRRPSYRRRKSRSLTPRRHKRRISQSRSLSHSPKSLSPSHTENGIEKSEQKDEKKRLQLEAEIELIEEETARRLEEAIRKNVEERLNSEGVKLDIEMRILEGRKKLFDDVCIQLEKEKEVALNEARQKEEQARREREELDKMLEENRRRVEEAQRREALELQRKEEERHRELELIQRQKEEAARRKKVEEEEQRANQMKLFGNLNKSRSKMH